MEDYREEKREGNRCIYQSKNKGRKLNEDVNGNRKLFWKEVSNAKGGKMKSCNRIKDGNGRLTRGKNEERMIWKAYFEDLLLQILRNRLQTICVVLMGFEDATC